MSFNFTFYVPYIQISPIILHHVYYTSSMMPSVLNCAQPFYPIFPVPITPFSLLTALVVYFFPSQWLCLGCILNQMKKIKSIYIYFKTNIWVILIQLDVEWLSETLFHSPCPGSLPKPLVSMPLSRNQQHRCTVVIAPSSHRLINQQLSIT